jgi:hypothetical protein
MKLLLAFGLILVFFTSASLYLANKNYRAFFLSRDVPLKISEEALGGGWFEVRLQKGGGAEVTYALKHPDKAGVFPAVIVIGGLDTGKKSVEITSELAGDRDLILMGMDYPYFGKRSFKGLGVVPHIPGMRQAALDCVQGVVMMVDFLHQRPDVDTEHIILIGVSLGAPVAVVAAGVDERITAVSALYGGGNLRPMVRSVTGSALAGYAAALLLAPLEPLDYVDDISPRPLLMINSPADEIIPFACSEELFSKAGEPKKMIRLETDHVLPDQFELLGELIVYVDAWLDEEGLIEKKPPAEGP